MKLPPRSTRFLCLLLLLASLSSWTARPAAADEERYFPQTGYKVRNAAFLNFFDRRGGVRTFGYPISREFVFLGARVQFFQRGVMQLREDGTVTTMNILDPGLMPYTKINGATFPAVDPALQKAAPLPSSPGYATAILAFTKASAPDLWQNLAVGFHKTFLGTVTAADAYPGGKGDAGLLPGFDLELWGVPTSQPAFDPKNNSFVYQRFQRGIMHFDKASGTTQGLLLADYLKAILTGQNLPPDLEEAAKSSPLYKQYDPTKDRWVARPKDLPGSDLRMAFEREPLIALDPGHGGTEVGASFKFADGFVLREKNLTLDVANRTAAILREAGYQVILTRPGDVGANDAAKKDLNGDKAVNLEDELQARIDAVNAAQATLLLSIHFNGLDNPDARGTEVYYCPARPTASQSLRFATLVQQKLVAELKVAGYESVDRGVRVDERAVGVGNHLYVLGPEAVRPATMPAVLAEGLFLTNPTEAARLRDPKLLAALAQGYAKAVRAYYEPG